MRIAVCALFVVPKPEISSRDDTRSFPEQDVRLVVAVASLKIFERVHKLTPGFRAFRL